MVIGGRKGRFEEFFGGRGFDGKWESIFGGEVKVFTYVFNLFSFIRISLIVAVTFY